MKMQQKLAEYRKRNVEEMEALRKENARLKRKIEADKATSVVADFDVLWREFPSATEEESQYWPTTHIIGVSIVLWPPRRITDILS